MAFNVGSHQGGSQNVVGVEPSVNQDEESKGPTVSFILSSKEMFEGEGAALEDVRDDPMNVLDEEIEFKVTEKIRNMHSHDIVTNLSFSHSNLGSS